MTQSIAMKSLVTVLILCILGLSTNTGSISAKEDYPLLVPNFYHESCPDLYNIVKEKVKMALEKEKRMGASLVRLFFHDCFVHGCDASVLLDDSHDFIGEKTARPNFQSIRGFEVIDEIKAAVEHACPEMVSCADVLAITARDSVVQLGGPYWDVHLGRRDSLTANKTLAEISIPPPIRNLHELITNFHQHGLNVQDLVALSGCHTIGLAKCSSFRGHIYNDTNINHEFAAEKKAYCPEKEGHGNDNLAPLDYKTPVVFDNYYFKLLVEEKGLLHSDQELFKYGHKKADYLVKLYSYDQKSFFDHFAVAMMKMGSIKPLVGHEGEIRKNCRLLNKYT